LPNAAQPARPGHQRPSREGDVDSRASANQEIVEHRPPVVIERNDLAVEHATDGQRVEQPLEALQPVAVLREHAAGDGIGETAKAVELEIEDLAGMVKGIAADRGDDGRETGHLARGDLRRQRSAALANLLTLKEK